MQQYNIHAAKTHLSALVEKAPQKWVGFLKGEIEIPADFDQMGQREIIELFGTAK
jgi:hypothetical protein